MSDTMPTEPSESSWTLAELAGLVGGAVRGDGTRVVRGVAPVDEAAPDDLAFLALARYARFVDDCRTSAFLVAGDLVDALPDGSHAIVVDDPYPALRTLLDIFFPEPESQPGVHATAVVGRNVRLGRDVEIGPYAVLGDRVTVGDGVRIGAHCVLGSDSAVGDGSRLHPHVVLYDRTALGRNVIVHAGARLGSDGFGYTFVDGAHRKIPQVGRCVIGDEVEIGANTTIDRGSLGDTVIGSGSKIDNLVQVAHNVRIGARSLLAALVGIAGSTRIGENVWVGGQAGLINQLEVGDGAKIAVASKVYRSIPAGETVSGHPARPHREELRRQAHLSRIPKLERRVADLERRLDEGAPS